MSAFLDYSTGMASPSKKKKTASSSTPATSPARRIKTRGPSYADNRKAHFDYELLDRTEAGIELLGTEVKSIRAGRASLIGAYVVIRGNEAYLLNASIPAFQEKNAPKGYDPMRQRRLLVSAAEIAHLTGIEKTRGLTLIPISLYNYGRSIKLEIAVARGKKNFDKRQSIRRRDDDRSMERTLKYGSGTRAAAAPPPF